MDTFADDGPSGVLTVEVLFARFGSGVALVTVPVLWMTVPPGRLGLTLTTSTMSIVPPTGSVARVHVTVPVPPGGGATQESDDGAVLVADSLTNVVPVGIWSVTTTLCASDGPAFVMCRRYVRVPPGRVVLLTMSRVLVRLRSASVATRYIRTVLLTKFTTAARKPLGL
jgi:hypothetical protein